MNDMESISAPVDVAWFKDKLMELILNHEGAHFERLKHEAAISERELWNGDSNMILDIDEIGDDFIEALNNHKWKGRL